MKKIKNNKGITLMALVITIIILIILASVGIYSGIQVVKSAQFTAFSAELKIMQTQVNKLYEEKRNGNDEYVDNLGTTISNNATAQTQANKVFTANASEITDQEGYKYFDTNTLKSLNIEGVNGEFFININKRSVVSYEGFEYEGKTYYTLEQLPDGMYNVEHEISDEKPTFDLDYDFLENGSYKITVFNIKYHNNINKFNVQYQKQGSNSWSESNNYSFNVETPGMYNIKIVNNEYESSVKQLEIIDVYSKISQEVKVLLNMRYFN